MSDKKEFHPWNDNENKISQGLLDIDVPEPPCKDCKKWRPRILTNNKGDYSGAILCIADNMYHDFSCFQSKE